MDRQIVKLYIEEYKKNFFQVHKQEIYKWIAIKQFQENFNIESTNFYNNVELSLSKTGNLLESGQYFPKKMLLENIHEEPESVREMFQHLFDEDFDIIKRIKDFRNDFGALSQKLFPNKKNHYQDHRAVIVYLNLMYPERYFFYKYGMFKDFAKKVDFIYQPIAGKNENIGQFQNLCELIRFEIEKDQELLNLHVNRLDKDCYHDRDHNVLTQDFIYAVVSHLNQPNQKKRQRPKALITETKLTSSISIKHEEPDLRPRIINHIQNNIENKRIGDLGERWVLKNEMDYLSKNGRPQLARKVKHVAKDQGDGLGYDILSFDLDGNEKYIEVKTTKGGLKSTFYVTRNELEKSKIALEQYFLYRVYDYNEHNESAKLLQLKGDLTPLCKTASNYQVNLE